MTGRILTLNAGSSSLKFGLFDAAADAPAWMEGAIQRIGEAPRLDATEATGSGAIARDLPPEAAADHAGALETLLAFLGPRLEGAPIVAVGHRVVHGGPDHGRPTPITRALLSELEALAPFAPLHQPHNIAGIRSALAAFPGALQVACFDTAFHRGQPFVNDVFGLPRAYYDKGVRRYGFHGLSYEYVAGELRRIDPQLHAGRVVVAHLGNGASMCGMIGGRSVTSTMGFSPLDGLPMGTRSGQLDPGVVLYLMEQEGMDAAAISDLLYRRSGLLGLSGLSNDMRTLEAAETAEAGQAIDYFVTRIRRELGAIAAVLGGLDAVVFCGGIGENSSLVRARACRGMEWIGIELDPARNEAADQIISTPHGRVRVMIIPTDEEAVIARAVRAQLARPHDPGA
jgi:acetate kinase